MANELVTTLIKATDLPGDSLLKEFDRLLASHGTTSDDVTLEQLREIMADYLQTILLETKEELSA